MYQLEKWHVYYYGLFYANEKLRKCGTVTNFNPEVEHGDDFFWQVREAPYLLSGCPADSKHVLLTGKKDGIFHRSLYRCGYKNKSCRKIESAKSKVVGWIADTKGNYRIRKKLGDKTNEMIYEHCWIGEENWKVLSLPGNCSIIGFSTLDHIIMVRHFEGDFGAQIQYFDIKEDQFIGSPITDDTYSMQAGLIRNNKNGDILGISYQKDKKISVYFDDGLANVMKMVNRAIPGMAHSFMGIATNGNIIFSSYSDRQPQIIHSLDLKKKDIKILCSVAPWIDAKKMSPTKPIVFKTRDGVDLHGYLTLPKEGKAPFPTIVNIHGGPKVRDRWGFDAETQFLAKLGFAVLKVNYRGSSGYKGHISKYTLLETCQYVVDDVNDAVKWAIGEGYVDREHIALYGASFGGYGALALATFQPEYYQCAVGVAGVYDMMTQLRNDGKDGFARIMKWNKDYYDEFEQNKEAFKEVSPLFHADKINIPIYLLHGGADTRVSDAQSKRMHKQILENGGSSLFDKQTWGIHGFIDEKKRIKHWVKVAGFLKENI